MSKFNFLTDNDSEAFCTEILEYMINNYGITENIAVEIINYQFDGVEFIGDHLFYHESPDQWAEFICFDESSRGYEMIKLHYNMQ